MAEMPEKLFFCINSMTIFSVLLKAVNEEAIRLTTQNEVAKSSFKRYTKVSICELLRFFGI